MNKKVVLLSMDNTKNFFTYDKLLIEPMKNIGWDAEEISWRNESVDWNDYDAVIVRSTWDYQKDHKKFLDVLEKINNSSAHLENDLELMKWNMNKKYLFDLEQNGVRIVNTLWKTQFNFEELKNSFEIFSTKKIIIKPNISANADNTFRLTKEKLVENKEELELIYTNLEFMVQPFMGNIVDEGEYSLFFFNGEFSHCVLKKPKEKDFRVQEEHGGKFKSVIPTAQQISISKNVVSKLSTPPLYARTDLVRTIDNEFALMELEVIEPSLYFNMDEQSPINFTKAFVRRMKNIEK
jgi:glutathione synthase/RimK-type ligase-like ATP-grasp enzyme